MRLLPRFSLRTVWIALTVFLIVFGVVVNYYQRYLAHEQIATKLQNLGYDVEETTSTLLGFTIGKSLTGLHSPVYRDGPQMLAALRELPRPRELLRFSNLNKIRNQQDLGILVAALEQFPNLEELYLEDLVFTEAQFAIIGGLTKLRILSLKECDIPPGGIELLARMTRLEKLLLNEAHFHPVELQALTLPNLRVLDLSQTSVTELALTKAGMGRSPNLETLIVGESSLDRETCEAGALPNLRHLDLANQDRTLIDWPALPAAAPQLDTFALHAAQLSADSAAALRQLPRLRYMYFNTAKIHRTAEHVPATSALTTMVPAYPGTVRANSPRAASAPKIVDVVLAVGKEALANQFSIQRPGLLFCSSYGMFHTLIDPIPRTSGGQPWASANWRQGEEAAPIPPQPPFPIFSTEPLEEPPALPEPNPLPEPAPLPDMSDPSLKPELQSIETPPLPDLKQPLPTPTTTVIPLPQPPGGEQFAPLVDPFQPTKEKTPAPPQTKVRPLPSNNPIAPFTNPLGLPANESPVPTIPSPLRELEK